VTQAADALLKEESGTIAALIHAHALERPTATALVQDGNRLDYAGLDSLVDRVAATLQRDGLLPGDIVAVCAKTSIAYAAVFLGALRAGIAVAPLAPSSTPRAIASMVADCDAKLFFLDESVARALATVELPAKVERVALDGSANGQTFETWLAPADATPVPVSVDPERAFNIIYSSGTTGEPKGIVHSYAMRWLQLTRAVSNGYSAASVTIVSTPLYSNTTLVSFLPTLGYGGTAVLMEKFDAEAFLQLAEKHRATHAMLVPVQYRRIMAVPDFDRYDLTSFVMKLSTSAPFGASVKADVLKRWPGGLTEYYGLTEGGGTCVLAAHLHPDKLHTVGQPAPDHDIRLIDEAGREVPQGEIGEIVGHSAAIMNGYYKRPERTAEAEWHDASGKRFIRSGDVGRFDADGFLVLMDRKKDMIISGGFNIYPSDLEAILAGHEAIAEAAVVGVASERWGETPVAFVVLKAASTQSAEAIRDWLNGQVGKTQRLSGVEIVPVLPRSAIGKVLKRELRDRFGQRHGA
jgi:acyl-CoA synthetase (AMP-forming)/AMP-acid ligase II